MNKLQFSRATLYVGLGLVALISSGCRTTAYNSSSLPVELLASPTPDMSNVDIPAMGVRGVRSDILYPGDLVECEINAGAADELEEWEARVLPDGKLDVPLVGLVSVGGQTLSAAEAIIRQASVDRQVYRSPKVLLTVKSRQQNKIQVAGAVSKPGVYEIPTVGSNLVAALTAAGGVLAEAGEIVEIHDPELLATGAAPITLNLNDATENRQGDIYLNDGAMVRVDREPEKYVQILGNAQRNQTIKLEPDRELRLLDALAQAGGLRYSTWICDKVVVTRQNPQSNESAQIQLSVRKARKDLQENVILAAGDVISIEENPVTFTLNTIQGLMGVGVSATTSMAAIP